MNNLAVQDTERRRHRRRGVVVGTVVVVLICLIGWRILGHKAAKHAMPGQVVSVAAASLGNMPETLAALGTVTPTDTVTVLPQLSGYLTEVAYKEGEDVKKGQFLAQIDPRQYEISKQQAEAELAKDQASLAQARTDLARYTQLHRQQSIAEQTFADQQFTVQQDEAMVKVDEAAIAQYSLDIAYCHITAPIAGRVGLRLVDVGNYVTASSSPGIVTITTMRPTTVEFAVPQASLGAILQRFNSGAQLPVAIYDATNTKQIATGTLHAIGNQMVTGTGTVTLRATVPNDNESLFPNEFVNVQLLVNTLTNAVLVPTPAVQSGAPGDYVYLVNADDTVSVHKVTPGSSDGKNTVILSGLAAGQHVVTDGMDRLSDGAKIKIAGAKGTDVSDPATSRASATSRRSGKRRRAPGSSTSTS